MSHRKIPDDSNDDLPDDRRVLKKAMSGVRPLKTKAVHRPPTEPPATPTAPAHASAPKNDTNSGSIRFELIEEGERLAGLAPGIDRAHLKRLRAGEVPVDREIDLHRLRAAAARAALRDTLEEALAAGERCVLAIHGRGLHSQAGAVLKQQLVTWLAEPPLGPHILAFTSAPPALGGTGATLILLRRIR